MWKIYACLNCSVWRLSKFALCRQREQEGRSDSEEDEIATFESASLSEEEDVGTGGMVYLHVVLLSLSFFFIS